MGSLPKKVTKPESEDKGEKKTPFFSHDKKKSN